MRVSDQQLPGFSQKPQRQARVAAMLFSRVLFKHTLVGAVAARISSEPPSNQHALGHNNGNLLESTIDVLETMQANYFENWLGTWPTAIDWTAAVMGTHVSGALSTISRALDIFPVHETMVVDRRQENLVTLFFSQVLSFYFGQDSFAIRNEAYDDILWVVLGWLETIQFINLHTDSTSRRSMEAMIEYLDAHGFEKWHGNIWIPAFAHRSRIFWNLARSGWDKDLCGGGIVWNPRLEPYKNAITNQLLISASASMYLNFPGDWNHSPFFSDTDITSPDNFARPSANDVFRPSDPAFLEFALDGYNWLNSSGMKNRRGLYIDGFHISGWNDPKSTNKRCDVRNEQVYTYNQGVILTGQLNLWKITGNRSYVRDGHELVGDVIRATGWDLAQQRPFNDGIPYERDSFGKDWRWPGAKLPIWHGIGRAGVMEDVCDSKGTCSQDAQTFKGIFFHHLTAFCSPSISADEFLNLWNVDKAGIVNDVRIHLSQCGQYVPWLKHNTHAMMKTRNADGNTGMWWTAGLLNLRDMDDMPPDEDGAEMMVPDAVDYRNDGVPDDPTWRRTPSPMKPPSMPNVPLPGLDKKLVGQDHLDLSRANDPNDTETLQQGEDVNDRGRGRTVETQAGGLALLRAYWEISDGPGRARRKHMETAEL